jgi:hypothetical protein
MKPEIAAGGKLVSWAEEVRAIARSRYEVLQSAGSAAQDPEKVIHVNPAEIARACKLHTQTKATLGYKWYDWGRVEDGDWDDTVGPANSYLDRTPIHQSVLARYVDNVPWELTSVLPAKEKVIARNGRVDSCSNREELLARYARLDQTFESIRENGFQLQNDRKGQIDLSQTLTVSITRHGEMLFGNGGAHRLAIAKLLRLPTIPVLVMMRHAKWQQIIDAAFKDGRVPPALVRHPDLAEIYS